jgi:hypothetical protein
LSGFLKPLDAPGWLILEYGYSALQLMRFVEVDPCCPQRQGPLRHHGA